MTHVTVTEAACLEKSEYIQKQRGNIPSEPECSSVVMVSSMNNINIWDDRAALESCWFDCESFPTAAYNYPSSDKDFIYLTGYR